MLIDDILKDLNEGQKKAAQHIHGPALVIATAGSGNNNILNNI